MGFIMHFYIIFGTNRLTEGPMQIAVFLPISVFRRKGISNGIQTNETLGRVIIGTNVIQGTWSRRQEINEEGTRQGGAPAPPGAPPTLLGPSQLHRPTSSSYIYPYTPKTSRSTMKPYFHRRNLLYPRDPILRPFPELHRRGNQSRRASTSTP